MKDLPLPEDTQRSINTRSMSDIPQADQDYLGYIQNMPSETKLIFYDAMVEAKLTKSETRRPENMTRVTSFAKEASNLDLPEAYRMGIVEATRIKTKLMRNTREEQEQQLQECEDNFIKQGKEIIPEDANQATSYVIENILSEFSEKAYVGYKFDKSQNLSMPDHFRSHFNQALKEIDTAISQIDAEKKATLLDYAKTLFKGGTLTIKIAARMTKDFSAKDIKTLKDFAFSEGLVAQEVKNGKRPGNIASEFRLTDAEYRENLSPLVKTHGNSLQKFEVAAQKTVDKIQRGRIR